MKWFYKAFITLKYFYWKIIFMIEKLPLFDGQKPLGRAITIAELLYAKVVVKNTKVGKFIYIYLSNDLVTIPYNVEIVRLLAQYVRVDEEIGEPPEEVILSELPESKEQEEIRKINKQKSGLENLITPKSTI